MPSLSLENLSEIWGGMSTILARWALPMSALVISLLGFFRNRRTPTLTPVPEMEAPSLLPPPQAFYFATVEDLVRGQEQLERYVQAEKPHLNPELRLFDLAKDIKLKPYQVSEVFSRGMGTTFYDYINGLRVEEIKRRLADPRHAKTNLLDLAHDCGFNSKSVFNESFKKITGMTPTEYRRSRVEQ